MGLETDIEWADDTANFWEGCTQISRACDICYAMERAERYGTVKWNGPPRKVKAGVTNIRLANQRAQAEGRVRTVFINSLSDIFDKNADPDWRRECFDEVKRAPWIVAIFLTKRIGNAAEMSAAAGGFPTNAALGATVIDQMEADRDVPKLIKAKKALGARWAFLSIEPILGAIDLTRIPGFMPVTEVGVAKPLSRRGMPADVAGVEQRSRRRPSPIDAVIVGGESGRKARPACIAWVRALLTQCTRAGVAFFFKQWGEWQPRKVFEAHEHLMREEDGAWGPIGQVHGVNIYPIERVGKKAAGRTLDGRLHNDFLKIDRTKKAA